MALGMSTNIVLICPTADEREKLQLLASRPKTSQRSALRASIILACADGNPSNREVAQHCRCDSQTVRKWRNRFAKEGIGVLCDAPRSGRPRTISDAKVEEVLTKTLESPPANRSHWSRRTMAKAAGIGRESVGRIWRTFGVKPHVVNNFKISTDPCFAEKVRDIVGLYLSPPANAIVLSVDEKSQCQALERSQPVLPLDLGRPEMQTHDYLRHGTASLFAALEVATGKVTGECYGRHRHQEFIKFLDKVDAAYPEADYPGEELHLILDNYATHSTPAVSAWLARHPRFHFHFTPTGASWINQIERFFGLITEGRIRRGNFASVKELVAAIKACIEEHNTDPKPFIWTKSADQILEKIGKSFAYAD